MPNSSPRLLILYAAHSPVCGIGTWIECLSGQLDRRGWDVLVGLSWGQRFHKPQAVEALRPTLQTIYLDGRTGTKTGRWLAIQNAIRRVKPDVVLVTLLDDGFRVLQGEKARGSRVRFAFANHGNAPGHLAAAIELSAELDLVVSVNRYSYELLRDWPQTQWGPGVLNYISNAVPPPLSPHLTRREKIRIGFVGRLSEDKGAEQIKPLVHALRERNCDFQFTVAGDGPFSQDVRQLAAQFPEQFHYLGRMNRDQLYRQVYPALDLILCLSPSEGWPMSIAEAMIHGVAPVSSEYIGIHVENVIRNNETGVLFPVGRPDMAADRIVELAGDAAKLSRLKAGAQRKIVDQHSLESFGNRWNSCLREALRRAPRRSDKEVVVGRPTLTDGAKECVRRLLRMSAPHASIRAEWPMIVPRDKKLSAAVRDQIRKQVDGCD